MKASVYTLPFEECDKSAQSRVGGKCASLGTMIQAGAPVPPGFAVTTDAYVALLASDGLSARIAAILGTVASSDDKGLEEVSQQVKK